MKHDALKWLQVEFEADRPELYEQAAAAEWQAWWEAYRTNGNEGLTAFPHAVLPTVLLQSELTHSRTLEQLLLRDAPGHLHRQGVKVKAAAARVSRSLDAFTQRPDRDTRQKCLVSFKRLRRLLDQAPRSVVFPQWCFPES